MASPTWKIQSLPKLRQFRKWLAEIPDRQLGLTGIGTGSPQSPSILMLPHDDSTEHWSNWPLKGQFKLQCFSVSPLDFLKWPDLDTLSQMFEMIHTELKEWLPAAAKPFFWCSQSSAAERPTFVNSCYLDNTIKIMSSCLPNQHWRAWAALFQCLENPWCCWIETPSSSP